MADSKLTGLTEVSSTAIDDYMYFVDTSDTTDGVSGSSRKISLSRLFGPLNQICCGRLTLTSATPVTTADVSGASTLYFTPYKGNSISLYDGTRWRLYRFTELFISFTMLTSGKNYDVFIYDNSGTLTLELSAAWTSDTARNEAITLQDGVYVKSGATTRRYLGTFRSTGTMSTEDSAAKRFLWNYYNPEIRSLAVRESSSSWTYTTATWRYCNNSATNQVEVVVGVAGRFVDLKATNRSSNSSAAIARYAGIGYDVSNDTIGYIKPPNVSQSVQDTHTAEVHHPTGIGYHYYSWLEYSAASGTTTWTGASECGLMGIVWG